MASKKFGLFKMLFPFAVAGTVATTDHYLKGKFDRELPTDSSKGIKKGHLVLRKLHNKGGFLGFGEKYSKEMIGVSIFGTAISFFSLLGACARRGRFFEKAGYAFILGGAASNTYDRVKKGYVIDYASLDVKPKKIKNIVFNLSDVFIFFGSILVFISNLTSKDRVL